MATSERVAAFLAHASIVDALCASCGGGDGDPGDGEAEESEAVDVVDVLSEVASLSDQYIPTLQFLIRPDNRTCSAVTLGIPTSALHSVI